MTALGRSFCSATGFSVSCGCVALKQQRVDIILGVSPAILVQNMRFFRKAHRGKSVILGDYNISGINPVDKGEIYAVCPFVKYKS